MATTPIAPVAAPAAAPVATPAPVDASPIGRLALRQRIAELESENAKLKQQLAEGKKA